MKRSLLGDLPEVEVKVYPEPEYVPSTYDVSGDPACTEYMRARGIDPKVATVPQICEALNASGRSDRPLTVSADGKRLDVDMRTRPAPPSWIEIIGGDAVDALGFVKAEGAMTGKTRFARPGDFGMTEWPRIYEVKYAEPRIELARKALSRLNMVLDKDSDEDFTWHSTGPAPVLPMSGLSIGTLDLLSRGAALTW